MSEDCRQCSAGRAHCHGTLIRHADHHWHCTEADCHHPEVFIHSLVLDCAAIGCECADHQDGRLAI